MRGNSHQVAVAVDTAKVTCWLVCMLRTSLRPWSISVRPRPTCSSKKRPASVVSTPLWRRLNSETPNSSSKLRMAWLIAGWLTESSSAALVKLPVRAALSKAISWFSVLEFSRFCMNVVYAKNEPLCGSQAAELFLILGWSIV